MTQEDRARENIDRMRTAPGWVVQPATGGPSAAINSAKPIPSVVERSQPHDGKIVFEVVGDPLRKLKRAYWTARKTTDAVVLTFRETNRLEEFPSDLGKHPVSGKNQNE